MLFRRIANSALKLRRSAQQGVKNRFQRNASHGHEEHHVDPYSLENHGHHHHHELVVFTDGPPTKFQVLRWILFMTLGPTTLMMLNYYFQVYYPVKQRQAKK